MSPWRGEGVNAFQRLTDAMHEEIDEMATFAYQPTASNLRIMKPVLVRKHSCVHTNGH